MASRDIPNTFGKDGEFFPISCSGAVVPPTNQKGMFFIMAKKTMEAIRQAELDAEQLVKKAYQQADAKINEANAQAEQLQAQARDDAAKKLADTRAKADADAKAAGLAADENVTGEIEALRRQAQKNESKAIAAVMSAMR